MPFIVYHDDPRLMAGVAENISNYGEAQDAQQASFRQKAFNANREDAAYGRQRDAAQDAMHIQDRNLSLEQARLRADAELEQQQRHFQDQVVLEEMRQKGYTDRNNEDNKAAGDRQQNAQGFKLFEDTVTGVGKAVKDGIAGVWNTVTGNDKAGLQDDRQEHSSEMAQKRHADILVREQERNKRSDAWRAEIRADKEMKLKREDRLRKIESGKQILEREVREAEFDARQTPESDIAGRKAAIEAYHAASDRLQTFMQESQEAMSDNEGPMIVGKQSASTTQPTAATQPTTQQSAPPVVQRGGKTYVFSGKYDARGVPLYKAN
jgi:hypothetical protein